MKGIFAGGHSIRQSLTLLKVREKKPQVILMRRRWQSVFHFGKKIARFLAVIREIAEFRQEREIFLQWLQATNRRQIGSSIIWVMHENARDDSVCSRQGSGRASPSYLVLGCRNAYFRRRVRRRLLRCACGYGESNRHHGRNVHVSSLKPPRIWKLEGGTLWTFVHRVQGDYETFLYLRERYTCARKKRAFRGGGRTPFGVRARLRASMTRLISAASSASSRSFRAEPPCALQ